MQTRRTTLLAALLVSILLHGLVVASRQLALTDIFQLDDEVLESRMPAKVQRIRLAPRPPPAAESPATDRVTDSPMKPGNAAATTQAPVTSATPPAGADDQVDAIPATDAAPPDAPIGIPADPAPAFPVQLEAELEARLNGIPVTLSQSWAMEGRRYSIRVSGRKFGFQALLESEGRISPEGGLVPEASQLTVAGKIRNFTRYADGVIRYGKPESPREAPLPVVPQDFASLPFHLAVTFDGRPQSIFVSTGRGVYQVRFSLEAEEKLRLPVGTLRTLHVAGEFFEPDLGAMVRAFDIWLAPDYLNFPVKVSGHLRSGDPIDYRIRSLVMEGQVVLGDRQKQATDAPGEAIPEWLQQRVQPEGLKSPR